MRTTWPYLVGVVIIGAAIGTAIGGIPSSDRGITIASGPSATNGPTHTSPPDPFDTVTLTTVPTSNRATTVDSPPTTATPATSGAATTTTPPATSTSTISTSTTAAPTTTTRSVPTPPSTAAPTTTAASTTAVPALLDRADVRLIVANGDGRFNLVGRNVNRLLPLGYVTVDQTDVRDKVDRTILYFRPGFEEEAERLAVDLGIPNALIEPLPSTPVTANDDLGDVIAILGPDAIR
jgi:hypothetical protein